MSIPMNLHANNMIPTTVNPDNKTITLNQSNPVSNNPIVEGIERDSDIPIIVIPGVMGSRLWMKGDGKNVQL